MIYELNLSPIAYKHLKEWSKTGQINTLKKISKLLDELRQHPTTGTGKPEKLKGNLQGLWSRRITQKDRMIYQIDNNKIIVYVLSLMGHYDDK